MLALVLIFSGVIRTDFDGFNIDFFWFLCLGGDFLCFDIDFLRFLCFDLIFCDFDGLQGESESGHVVGKEAAVQD